MEEFERKAKVISKATFEAKWKAKEAEMRNQIMDEL